MFKVFFLFKLSEIVCSSGYFGMDCKKKCSGHCMNNEPCHHVSGMCTSGCQDGYIGEHCIDSMRYCRYTFIIN